MNSSCDTATRASPTFGLAIPWGQESRSAAKRLQVVSLTSAPEGKDWPEVLETISTFLRDEQTRWQQLSGFEDLSRDPVTSVLATPARVEAFQRALAEATAAIPRWGRLGFDLKVVARSTRSPTPSRVVIEDLGTRLQLVGQSSLVRFQHALRGFLQRTSESPVDRKPGVVNLGSVLKTYRVVAAEVDSVVDTLAAVVDTERLEDVVSRGRQLAGNVAALAAEGTQSARSDSRARAVGRLQRSREVLQAELEGIAARCPPIADTLNFVATELDQKVTPALARLAVAETAEETLDENAAPVAVTPRLAPLIDRVVAAEERLRERHRGEWRQLAATLDPDLHLSELESALSRSSSDPSAAHPAGQLAAVSYLLSDELERLSAWSYSDVESSFVLNALHEIFEEWREALERDDANGAEAAAFVRRFREARRDSRPGRRLGRLLALAEWSAAAQEELVFKIGRAGGWMTGHIELLRRIEGGIQRTVREAFDEVLREFHALGRDGEGAESTAAAPSAPLFGKALVELRRIDTVFVAPSTMEMGETRAALARGPGSADSLKAAENASRRAARLLDDGIAALETLRREQLSAPGTRQWIQEVLGTLSDRLLRLVREQQRLVVAAAAVPGVAPDVRRGRWMELLERQAEVGRQVAELADRGRREATRLLASGRPLAEGRRHDRAATQLNQLERGAIALALQHLGDLANTQDAANTERTMGDYGAVGSAIVSSLESIVARLSDAGTGVDRIPEILEESERVLEAAGASGELDAEALLTAAEVRAEARRYLRHSESAARILAERLPDSAGKEEVLQLLHGAAERFRQSLSLLERQQLADARESLAAGRRGVEAALAELQRLREAATSAEDGGPSLDEVPVADDERGADRPPELADEFAELELLREALEKEDAIDQLFEKLLAEPEVGQTDGEKEDLAKALEAVADELEKVLPDEAEIIRLAGELQNLAQEVSALAERLLKLGESADTAAEFASLRKQARGSIEAFRDVGFKLTAALPQLLNPYTRGLAAGSGLSSSLSLVAASLLSPEVAVELRPTAETAAEHCRSFSARIAEMRAATLAALASAGNSAASASPKDTSPMREAERSFRNAKRALEEGKDAQARQAQQSGRRSLRQFAARLRAGAGRTRWAGSGAARRGGGMNAWNLVTRGSAAEAVVDIADLEMPYPVRYRALVESYRKVLGLRREGDRDGN